MHEELQEYRELIKLPNHLICVISADGRFLKTNRAQHEILGWASAELSGQSVVDFVLPEDVRRTIERLTKLRSGETNVITDFENRCLHKAGGFRWISWSGSLTEGKIFCIGHDITARKDAERAAEVAREDLQRSRDQLDIVLDGVTDGITVYDPHGRSVYANEAGALMCGCASVQEYLDTPTDSVLSKFEILDEDGQTVPAERLPGRQALRGVRSPAEAVFQVRIKASGELRWAIINATPVFDDQGKVLFAVNIFRDFTARKRDELERERLLQVRDEFLSVASHELKTPLTPLKIQLQILRLLLDKGDFSPDVLARLRKGAETSDRQIDRLTALVDDLLDVARMGAGKLSLHREGFDLASLVREVADGHGPQAAASQCAFEVEVAGGLDGNWDRLRIEQVLINLLSNAIKYAPGKPIRVSATAHGGHAHLKVADQGKGISIEHQRRIFERFERLDSVEHVGGLGLGLYITREIVKAHEGEIFVESAPNQGASFTVKLPLA